MQSLLVVCCALLTGIAAADDVKVGTGDDFCRTLKENGAGQRPDGRSLAKLRQALESVHAVSGSLGTNAKDAGPQLEKNGFVSVNAPGTIPVGAVMVLRKVGSCPIDARHGHVAVYAGGDKMISPGEAPRSLKAFLAAHKECIAGVMVEPDWTDQQKKSLAEGVAAQPPSRDHRSLAHLRDAMKNVDPRITTLGTSAKDSVPAFERLGFKNVWAENEVPNGTILVLQKTEGCPVNEKTGHVAVKCGPDQLYWVAGQTKVMSSFMSDHPGCIKGMYARPEWVNQVKVKGPADAPVDGDGGTAH